MSASVRAKFVCTQSDLNGQVALQAVTSGGVENISFFEATPWGSLSMGIVSPSVRGQFVVGKEYYLDFTPAGPSHVGA